MKYIVHDQAVLSRPPEGPLAAYIGSFARSLSEQGYSAGSMKQQVRIAAGFSRWLEQTGVGVRSICADHAIRYLRYRARHVRPRRGDQAALRHLIDFLRQEQLIPAERVPLPRLPSTERCVQAYVAYLREARALATATIVNYVPFVRGFLEDCFGKGRVTLSRLCAGDVVRFVQRQAPRLQPKRAKLLTAALRSFLRYVRYRGDITLDLAAAVPVVANWSMPSIARGIAPDQTRQLLASIDQRSATGRRDYAILLLLARLGLRSGEVASLELDEIDWSAGRLSVRGKSGHRNELPLPADVGKAIATYLIRGRPRSTCRRVFLRARAPITGFSGASGVGSVVRHALQRAGIDAPTMGAHQFRHGLATEMLCHGASLGEIGELLGHHHPQTTKIYTKVDIKALRTLAVPWPGGVQ
ncbi:site-specific integrase [Caballeronia sordidicola]|uniref:Mobile element protein n=1 Tax=Caballeronia sordidicola TaxID=196367 RepID=A0A226X4F3_CABSO|nr:site-specific integrase [Caballeronia sordidicola]OXC78311.1 Mobile element protein [Caballeronia sordidicola]